MFGYTEKQFLRSAGKGLLGLLGLLAFFTLLGLCEKGLEALSKSARPQGPTAVEKAIWAGVKI